MSLGSIWYYSERALRFAVPVALLWAALCTVRARIRGEKLLTGRFWCGVLFAFYMALLVQMVAVRDWRDFFDLTRTNAETEIIWIPLKTTLRDAREMGILWECYHMAGNIAFFVPFGFLSAVLCRRLRSWRVMPAAALGMSFLLEFMQWVFQTGVSDVDDLILNTLGGCVGFGLWRLWKKRSPVIRKCSCN